MKNIFLLPTKKESRLVKGETTGRLLLHENYGTSTDRNETQHSYITSDEKIKKGDWCLHKDGNGVICKVTLIFEDGDVLLNNATRTNSLNFRKIILTTDQDLTTDGVQAIDDEFLEWFVKNPSCEFVKIKNKILKVPNRFNDDYRAIPYFKIIITKEDWKCCGAFYGCDKCERKKEYEYIGECKGNDGNGCFMDSPAHNCGCFVRKPKQETQGYICPETKKQCDDECCVSAEDCHTRASIGILSEPKQETLEEAAEREAEIRYPVLTHRNPKDSPYVGSKKTFKHGVDFGAKWQQERSYSEEDIEEYAEYCTTHVLTTQIGNPYLSIKDWFKQFKKK